MDSYESFYDWAMLNGYKDDLSIDRIDVNGNYEPSNCRWVDDIIQANNKRNNHILTYNGETHTLKEWSRLIGIQPYTLYNRVNKLGWTVGESLGFAQKPNRLKIQRPVCILNEKGDVIAEFPTPKEASKATNVSTGNINFACKGKYTTHGFVFRYKEDLL